MNEKTNYKETQTPDDNTTVIDATQYELKQYKQLINKCSRHVEDELRQKRSLLKQLNNSFGKYKDNILYFNIHVDSNSYIDDDSEMWFERTYTLEISFDSITPPLLAQIESTIGEVWELRADKHGVMCMCFNLSDSSIICEV